MHPSCVTLFTVFSCLEPWFSSLAPPSPRGIVWNKHVKSLAQYVIPSCLINVDFSSATVSSSAVTFGAYLYNHLVSNVKNSKMSEQTICKEQSA